MNNREPTWNKLHPWWKTAMQHGQRNATWFATKPGTEDHADWAAYFDRLGWMPEFFRRSWDNQSSEITLPCQRPEWMPDITQ